MFLHGKTRHIDKVSKQKALKICILEYIGAGTLLLRGVGKGDISERLVHLSVLYYNIIRIVNCLV